MEDFLTKNPFDGSTLTGVHKNAAKFFEKRKDWVGKTVIDLSCGHGVSTYILRKLGANVLPYELEPEYCKLPDKPAYANVLKRLPIEDNFADVVILQEVIEHLPNQLYPLQEACRILKPGGELFITTPSRSSIQGRLAYLLFEAENTKYTPWCYQEGVWGKNEDGELYFGHMFLIGIQQMNTLAKVAGFKKTVPRKTEVSKTSLILLPFIYPLLWISAQRAMRRDKRKAAHYPAYWDEKLDQYKLNLSMTTLLSKFCFVSFYK